MYAREEVTQTILASGTGMCVRILSDAGLRPTLHSSTKNVTHHAADETSHSTVRQQGRWLIHFLGPNFCRNRGLCVQQSANVDRGLQPNSRSRQIAISDDEGLTNSRIAFAAQELAHHGPCSSNPSRRKQVVTQHHEHGGQKVACEGTDLLDQRIKQQIETQKRRVRPSRQEFQTGPYHLHGVRRCKFRAESSYVRLDNSFGPR
mmetsp:Transcript_43497/g.114759  ORF Transcript_43497/g.114759 Transcript_43497/m.114759 type:complete len:204 (+) Transcript_43497:1186-1797(+)